jgi:hypothetical protein
MGNALYAAKEWAKNSLADIKARPRNALIDATRGALLGATTDVVGYIPDAVADFMRPFGYNVPRDQVVGGTEWLANKFAQPTNSLAENAARFTTGMLTPSPMDFARLGKGPMQELTVYHGSPHRINNVDAENPMGKFDTSKIGTGEGAQAYGHGIYLAESPDVAKSYVTLGHTQGNVAKIGGKPITDVYSSLDKKAATLPIAQAQANYDRMALLENLMNNQTPSEVLQYAKANGYAPETIKWFESDVAPKYEGAGHFYTVDLPDEHIANMLDWDAPLSQQPEVVKKALSNFASADDMSLTGGEFYRKLTQEFGAEPDDISADLLKNGVPGIRYLDGNSRMTSFAPRTDGTRNFVIFDGNTAKILKRE